MNFIFWRIYAPLPGKLLRQYNSPFILTRVFQIMLRLFCPSSPPNGIEHCTHTNKECVFHIPRFVLVISPIRYSSKSKNPSAFRKSIHFIQNIATSHNKISHQNWHNNSPMPPWYPVWKISPLPEWLDKNSEDHCRWACHLKSENSQSRSLNGNKHYSHPTQQYHLHQNRSAEHHQRRWY